ncbi:hypothetical protein LTR35_009614 [Friedmanniomyces endolithicus]|uniref:Killer toxin Kp4 domain-containing protein n=1 Tax=Friedmanniomyces endolithicus TaxID=329885 RepID=A0AAN6FR18_9PEZI|nr:hypothetical protein LTR35_009614 [Friedmanniomyces endolithicus]KAK0301179.1 hypothetical protein LTS00_000328 [Friedmanniomyces endolithicus]KAK0321229.1 hypothetical protein LTR82_007681 [Friedmanniomyces endolithicus]KAK0983896.1 hypothetical protein LTR54_014188 [Friedmanniomyces endolithicus]
MKLLVSTVALLFATTSATAVPAAGHDEGGPSPICLYMTNDYNWKGAGMNFCKVGGQCGSGLGPHLMKNVSSAGPRKGQTCFLYDGVDCTGHGSPPIVFPGYMNLSDPVINFDNRAQSWRCWKHCGYVSSSSSSFAASHAPSDTKTHLPLPPAVHTGSTTSETIFSTVTQVLPAPTAASTAP